MSGLCMLKELNITQFLGKLRAKRGAFREQNVCSKLSLRYLCHEIDWNIKEDKRIPSMYMYPMYYVPRFQERYKV